MERMSLPPLDLFYCYDYKDRKLLEELKTHLKSLRSSGRIANEEEACPGDRQEDTKERLESVHVILLLVSPAFNNSPSCSSQAKWAMERLNRGENVRVIPVLLRSIDVSHALFSHLEMLPSNKRPVVLWDNLDAAFYDIAMGIGKTVEKLQNQLVKGKPQPPPGPPKPLPTNILTQSKKWITKNKKRVIFASLLLFLLISSPNVGIVPPPPIQMWTTPMGEQVGISDGRFVFDTYQRADAADKIQAAKALASGKTPDWQKAIQEDPSDAEALIYQEDQYVLASGRPYITLVVATLLTGPNVGVGRDNLQGAYVAQKEFNGSSHPFQVRLLIANSGSGDESRARDVAQQIVQLASQDKTVVGVMGWPFSQSTVYAVQILASAHIPMVSETASTDDLSGVSPYFFRLVAPNFYQGRASAQYITQNLQAKRAALFVDPNNAYSNSLAKDFRQAYLSEKNGNSIVAIEQYTVGEHGQAQLSTRLQDALNANPDVIYFAGYANDLSVLLDALPSFGTGASLPIVGGEALYEISTYDQTARVHWPQLHFLSYAYPDEWEIAGLAGQKPHCFQEYSDAFNPSGRAKPGQYGFTRADNDVILSYDATQTLLAASTSVWKNSQDVTRDQLQQALAQINDAYPLQGASGRIAFGKDGNPINKPLLLVHFDPQNRLHEDKLLGGCLQVDHC